MSNPKKQAAYGDIEKTKRKEIYVEASSESCTQHKKRLGPL